MKVPAVGIATAVFGVLLIAGVWLYTIERVRTEHAEAVASEFSKNDNLALDVQTNQLLRGIDQFLLVIKSQHEQPGVQMPLRQLAAPVVSGSQSVTFIGVTDEHGDPTQFHQVLLNLCVNGRDAMPRGGLLTISAERVDTHPRDRTDVPAGAYVMLQVEDTGTGIHPDVADKIFDPFFTTKEPDKGTGLGLSTSLSIVKSHAGHIRASSLPGRGASFRIYLPVTAGPGPGSVPVAVADLPKGAGETVLVVDEEPAIRLIAQRTLESRGYRVLLAGDGAEAIAIFRAQYPSIALVMIDMTMPVLDGVPTIQALARIDPAVRIIAASGIHGNEQTARAASARVTHFLPKPFTADMLLKAIRQALA